MSVGLPRLREDAEAIRKGALDKGEDVGLVDRAIALDAERRAIQSEVDGLRATLKQKSAEVGAAVKGGAKPDSRDVETLKLDARDLGGRIADRDARLQDIESDLQDLLVRIPNPADSDVPVGGADANVTVRTWGEPRAREADGWSLKPHWELAEALDIIDNARGAKIAGSGFPI
jgi:seryl-tRNA synthetase